MHVGCCRDVGGIGCIDGEGEMEALGIVWATGETVSGALVGGRVGKGGVSVVAGGIGHGLITGTVAQTAIWMWRD